jgi:hypothetical protein
MSLVKVACPVSDWGRRVTGTLLLKKRQVSIRRAAKLSPDSVIDRDKAVKDPERQTIRWFEPVTGENELLLEFTWDRLAFEVWRDKYASDEVPE